MVEGEVLGAPHPGFLAAAEIGRHTRHLADAPERRLEVAQVLRQPRLGLDQPNRRGAGGHAAMVRLLQQGDRPHGLAMARFQVAHDLQVGLVIHPEEGEVGIERQPFAEERVTGARVGLEQPLAKQAPGPLGRRPVGREPAADNEGVRRPVLLHQIDAVAIGLGAGEQGLGAPLQQAVEVGFSPRGGVSRLAASADREPQTVSGVEDLATDVGLVAQPFAQVALQLRDRDPRLGNLHLDLVAPVVAVARRRAPGVGLGLQRAQPILELIGEHLAGQAAGGEVGRRGEGLDHQPLVGGRLPDQGGDEQADGRGAQGQEDLQSDPQPVGEVLKAEVLELHLQVMALVGDQLALVVQEGGRLRVHRPARAAGGAPEHQGDGGGIGRRRPRFAGGFRFGGQFAHTPSPASKASRPRPSRPRHGSRARARGKVGAPRL